MNRIFLVLTAFILLTVSAFAQNAPITTCGTVSNATVGAAVTVPVTVNNFSNIGAVSLRLYYNPTQLTFVSTANINPSLTGCLVNNNNVNATTAYIAVVWADVTPANIANGSKLFDANFTFNAGPATLSWDNTSANSSYCEYANDIGDVLNDSPTATYYINGSVSAGTTTCNLTVNAGADQTITAGQSASLTAVAANGTGAVTYAWSNSAGNTATVSVSPTATTTYTVTATDANACTATDQVTVTVSGPTCNMTVNAGADQTINAGQSASLTAVAANGTGAVTYAWSNSAGNTATVSVSPTTTTTYTVTATDANACTATDQVTVTVNSTVTCTPGNAPVTTCGSATGATVGAQVTVPVTVNCFSNIGAVSLRLYYNPTQLTFVSTSNLNASLTGMLVNNNNVNATTAYIAVVWADVTPANIADGGKLFDATFTYNNGPATISWDNTSANSSYCEYANDIGDVLNDAPTATYYVNGTVQGTVVTCNLAVDAGADQSITSGQTATLSAVATGAAGAVTYAWSNGAGNTATVSVSPTTTTTYTISVTDANNCTDTDVITVTVLPSSCTTGNAPVTYAGNATATTLGEQVTIPVTVACFNNIGAVSLRLYYDPSKITFVSTSNLNASLAGMLVNNNNVNATSAYIAVVWADVTPVTLAAGAKLFDATFTVNGPSALTWDNTSANSSYCEYANEIGDVLIDSPTANFYTNGLIGLVGINEININSFGISMYPNPTNSVLYFNVANSNGKSFNAEIINVIGQSVMSKGFESIENSVEKFDLSTLPNGIYFLKLTSGNETVLQKVVKE